MYRSFDKGGVGIMLDAGSRVALSSVVLVTDTPGFTAMILASETADGDFVDVSEEQEVGRRTTFERRHPRARHTGTTSSGSPTRTAART